MVKGLLICLLTPALPDMQVCSGYVVLLYIADYYNQPKTYKVPDLFYYKFKYLFPKPDVYFSLTTDTDKSIKE